MSKEEIFKDCLKQELNGRDLYSPAVIAYLNKEQTSAALSAMSIFSKQEAIAFAIHCNKGEDDRFDVRYEWFLKKRTEPSGGDKKQ